jgi:RNA polymerase sigma factor (sigma-70 family)
LPEHPTHQRERRFEALYDAHYASVLGYSRRRTRNAQEADDVLAETFLVAWRRLDEIPPQPLVWLLAVARRVLANQRRSERRRLALTDRLARDRSQHVSRSEAGRHGVAAAVRAALAELRERDREILMLVDWDGLDRREIARMLRCSRASVDLRLHRARRRMAALLAAAGHGQGSSRSKVEAAAVYSTGETE